jgi:hypothetical protein
MMKRMTVQAKIKNQVEIKRSKNDSTGALKLLTQREIAKAGMAGSLGVVFISGLFRFRGAGLLHPLAGWAFLGFSIWHHLISKSNTK